MKARIEGVSDHSHGRLVMLTDNGTEMGQMHVIGLNGVTSIKEYHERAVTVMKGVVDALTVYRKPVDETKITLPKVGERYRHYKGDTYEVVGLTRCSETLEPRVVYREVDSDEIPWDRPASMWFEIVDDKGTTRYTHWPWKNPMYSLDD